MKYFRSYIELLPGVALGGGFDFHDPSQVSQISRYSMKHHWIRLDTNTIIGVATVPGFSNLISATALNPVCVLPHLADTATVSSILASKTAINPSFSSVEALLTGFAGMTSMDTTATLIGKLIGLGHYQFMPDV